MKDFVKIQYSLLWKLYFDQSYFRLVEIITGIVGRQFSMKSLIFASGQLIFRLVETIFFLHLLDTPDSFFRLVEKYFSRKSLFSASGNGFQS